MRKVVHIRSCTVWRFVADCCLFTGFSGLPQDRNLRFESTFDKTNVLSKITKLTHKDVLNVWGVGSSTGLLRYEGDSLKQFRYDKNDPTRMSSKRVISIPKVDNQNRVFCIQTCAYAIGKGLGGYV